MTKIEIQSTMSNRPVFLATDNLCKSITSVTNSWENTQIVGILLLGSLLIYYRVECPLNELIDLIEKEDNQKLTSLSWSFNF